MAALGHLAVGFAAKSLAPKVPLGVMLAATEVNDVLWAVFNVTGIDKSASFPLSHGLLMSAVWSVAAALLAALIYRDRRSGIVIGLLVFSHWVVDLLTHPMGAIFGGKPLPPDLPLFFSGSPQVGLGLYNHSFVVVMAVDMGMLLLGVVIYATSIARKRKAVKDGLL